MRARLTAWLSALLLFNALFAIPVARVTPNGVSSAIVYVLKKQLRKQKKNPAEQVSESREAVRTAPRSLLAPPTPDRAALPLLDSSLFQRPPPALS